MHQKIIFLCCLLALLAVSPAKAQEPSYTLIGKEELSGIDIYNIIQDKKNNILLATSQGLVRYDGYDYYYYPTHNLHSLSLFGLSKNSKGDIYCFNLRGQILKVEEDSLSVFCQIPDTPVISGFSMAFDKNDDLIVGGNGHIFCIKPNGKTEFIDLPYIPSPYIGRSGDGNILISSISADSISIYSCGLIEHLAFRLKISGGVVFHAKKNGAYCHEANSYILYKIENNKISEMPLQQNSGSSVTRANLYFITKNESIWITTQTGGLYAFDKEGKARFNGHKLYGNYPLSAFLEDKEGNYWFTTLGKGILYVSNEEMKSYSNHPLFIDEAFIHTVYDKKGNIYLLSGSGKIFRLNNKDQVELLYDNPLWKFSFLSYSPIENNIYFNYADKIKSLSLDTKKNITYNVAGIGSVKDITYFNRDSFVAVGSAGICYHYGADTHLKSFSIRTGRCYRVFYDRNEAVSILLTSKGTELLKGRKISPFLDKGEAIYAGSITGNEDEIWLATSNKGIYKIHKGKIVQRITTVNGLNSTHISKVLLKGKRLFIAHLKGIQIYDTKTRQFESIGINDGLASNHILDFDVFENEICVVTSENIQRFDLNIIRKNETPPFLEMLKILVNNKRVDMLQAGKFTHSQNQIEFHFKAKAYQHRGELTYMYLLEGSGQGWKMASVQENTIKYLSLSPGTYNFQVRALNEYGIESETFSYKFVIQPPVWTTWWFWLIISVAIIGISFLVFIWQIERIKTKNRQKQELTSSKLAAIKSQMNPHFIFNALNSIQDLVLKEDIDNSYSYIVKFSNLVRKTLSYSDMDFIDLEDEINLLSIYLELEQLRVRDNFSYKIVDEVTDEIQIPPMLIQPFVENALKHGLLHKEGEKRLFIRFQLSDMLICTVEDNGIGRQKAQEIKTRQQKQHESFSVGATKTRFEILKKHYKKPLGLEYEDLVDEKGQACGTKVMLRIPYKQEY